MKSMKTGSAVLKTCLGKECLGKKYLFFPSHEMDLGNYGEGGKKKETTTPKKKKNLSLICLRLTFPLYLG